MGGFFGVAAKGDCVQDLFYGTDYHSHLGTRRGGLSVWGKDGPVRFIHDITSAQFRSKFEQDLGRLAGRTGIGVISDFEDQPIIIGSHLGTYAIVTVGVVRNLDALVGKAFRARTPHFSEMSGAQVNPTEVIATIINQGRTFGEGIRRAQQAVEGSCSMLLLTEHGIYAARDRLGRTPVILGRKKGAFAATLETCAFPNLGYQHVRDLGPGEIVRITAAGAETIAKPLGRSQICSFLWVYYGYPASSYNGVNVEIARNRCGAALARRDNVTVDMVSGIPDSGVGHAIGYAAQARVPYCRPFVKYTPTWARSFMPQDQTRRDLVARMKLIPVREMMAGQRVLFCEDSIVRGTQLQDTVRRLFDAGAREIHMRPACPPLVYGCKFLNFSRSRSELDLAARRAIREIEGRDGVHLAEYARDGSPRYEKMVERIRRRLNLTTLKYQRLADLVEAIGLPKEKLCTFCWDGAE
ncbi:MAG: amidophosphoribosyltransferase [Planctomycetota bacterium]